MRKLIIFCVLVLTTLNVSAQKYGHCNFANVLALMPETAASDKNLQALNDSLMSDLEAKANAMKAEYDAYTAAQQSGNESPRQLSTRENRIRKLQEEGTQMEQELSQRVEERRQELLRPIIEKVSKAIEEVAKENDYQLIFDTSMFNAVLFADETVDIMPLVKDKLGIEE